MIMIMTFVSITLFPCNTTILKCAEQTQMQIELIQNSV